MGRYFYRKLSLLSEACLYLPCGDKVPRMRFNRFMGCSMKRLILSVLVLFTLQAVVWAGDPPVSGTVVGGYRLLPVNVTTDDLLFTVYRGDYIKFEIDPSITDPVLIIPDFNVEERLPQPLAEAPYFKMKNPGSYPFTLGGKSGTIDVIEFVRPNYKAVLAKEAVDIIANIEPLILDVRTPREYQRGHLKNSTLIPVQELQHRWKEITEYQNRDVLIYCATGNRSTVASKILIDNGFKRIVNLRYGIVDWARRGYSVVQ